MTDFYTEGLMQSLYIWDGSRKAVYVSRAVKDSLSVAPRIFWAVLDKINKYGCQKRHPYCLYFFEH